VNFSQRDSRPDLACLASQHVHDDTTNFSGRTGKGAHERSDLFQREFEAQFTSDLESFLPWPDIHVAVQHWTELAPESEPYYVAALDASGLSGGDFFHFWDWAQRAMRLLSWMY